MPEKQALRIPQCNIVIGSPGAGKSTFISGICKKANKNVLVVKATPNINDPAFSWLTEKSLSGWRQGVAAGQPAKFKIAADDDVYLKEILPWLLAENFKQGILVIDDCSYYEFNQISKKLKKLLLIRRHLGLDIYLVYHGLTGCPIDQFQFSNHIILFNTTDNPGYKAKKLAQFEQLMEAKAEADSNYSKGIYRPAIVHLGTA